MHKRDPDDRYARLRASVATLCPELGWQELAAGTRLQALDRRAGARGAV